jgi:hypothetical protein
MACGNNSNQQWPTPQAAEYVKFGGMTEETAIRWQAAGHQEMLSQVIVTASGLPQETATGPDTSARVDLNPHFVEALMGLPKGWLTPCTLVETDWFQQWLQQHSLNYSTDTNTDA